MLNSDELRRKAEELLSMEGIIDNSLFQKDLKELVEELSIYKIELEHQNNELKRSQLDLSRAKERYLDLFQNAPLGYVVIDSDFKIKEINNTACKMLKLDYPKIIGKEITKFIHPLYQDTFYFFFQDILKQAAVYDKSCDLELRKSDFSFFSARIHRTENQGKDTPENIHLSITDISNEKFLESSLVKETEKAIKSEQMFRLIAQNTSDGIILINAGGEIEYTSLAYLSQIGLSEQKELGTNIYNAIDYVHPEDRAFVLETYKNAISNNLDTITYAFRIKHKAGYYIWRENHTRFLYDENGNHTKTIEVCRDITKRKAAEKLLQEQTSALNQIFDNAPYVLLFLDKNLKVENINKQGIQFTGKKVNEVFGNLSGAVFNCVNSMAGGGCGLNPDCSKCPIRTSAVSTLSNGGEILSKEARMRLIFGGEERDIDMIISTSLLNINGEDKILLSIADNTERKKAERELHKIAKLESLGVLAGGIAHNFKNILTAMSLSLEIIKLKPNRMEEHLHKIAISISQATALVTKFQTYSKGGGPELRPTNLHEIIEDSADMVLSGSSTTVEFNFTSQIEKVMLDDKQMQEVFANLLINADQAMPRGGKIKISTWLDDIDSNNKFKLSPGKYIHVDVVDEGMGIPSSHLEEIFTPFFTTKDKGQGLGLSSVFYIISKHNGHISVSSKIDEGTVFSIYLPYVPTTEKLIQKDLQPEINLPEGHLIYLLDDDLEIIDNLNDLAESLDINLVTFSNPNDIINAFAQDNNSEKVSVVILDLTLKGFSLNGFDVLNELKKIKSDVKALVFSGHSTMPIVAQYRKYGFFGRIEKPFDLHQFLHALELSMNDA
jgi:PAS domain S-box-containing protein